MVEKQPEMKSDPFSQNHRFHLGPPRLSEPRLGEDCSNRVNSEKGEAPRFNALEDLLFLQCDSYRWDPELTLEIINRDIRIGPITMALDRAKLEQ